MKRRIISVVAILMLLVGILVVHDVYQDRRHSLQILNSTPLLSEPYPTWYKKENTTIKTLETNEHVIVKRIAFGKDYMAIRVSTADGYTGYVISDENIKLHKKEMPTNKAL